MAGRNSVSPRRYAQALFQLGLERQALGQWLQDLEGLAAAARVPEFRAFLESVKVPDTQKLALLSQTLKNLSPDTQRFALLLAEQRVIEVAPAIHEAFQELMDRHYHRVRAQVLSAVPVTDHEKKRLSGLLSQIEGGKEVIIEIRVDPSIIGGLVIRVGDRLLDGSVRGRLRSMRQSLENRAIHTES